MLSVFELASSLSGRKLIGENLAGGTDPGGTVGGAGKSAGTSSVFEGVDGKFGHAIVSCCGVRDRPLVSTFVSRASGQDKEEKKEIAESNKACSSDGEKVGPSEPKTWSSLFGRKLNGKSSFPPVTSRSSWEKGEFQIFIPDPLMDFSVSSMDFTLVGKILGARPVLDSLRKMVKSKWALRGEVDIAPMQNGFLLFNFNCKEDLNLVLCGGP
jgi:hypothetical protein